MGCDSASERARRDEFNISFVNSAVANIPMKLKLKSVYDFGEKNISISVVLDGGKL
ncbi:hypothetical protein A2U01_0059091, partial [Trifolium medium]|nr:hypothetical protein [Trifolium medium]